MGRMMRWLHTKLSLRSSRGNQNAVVPASITDDECGNAEASSEAAFAMDGGSSTLRSAAVVERNNLQQFRLQESSFDAGSSAMAPSGSNESEPTDSASLQSLRGPSVLSNASTGVLTQKHKPKAMVVKMPSIMRGLNSFNPKELGSS